MRRHLYLTAVALSLGLSAGAFAQGGGSGFGGGGTGAGGGSSFGGGGTSFSGSSGGGGGTSFSGSSGGGGSSFTGGGGTSFSGSSGGSGSSFTGGGGTSFTGGGTGMSGGTGRTGVGGRSIGGSGGFTVSPTNILAGTFANPLYPGRPGSTSRSPAVGGFGQPSFGSVTSVTTTNTGLGGRGTATVNRGGMTGGVGSGQSNTPAISYATTLGFAAPPVFIPAVRAHLQGIISRTSALRAPGNVRVESDGDAIVLRGKVADEGEKRLVEGMVRLEPGVHEVRNELEIGP